MNPHVTALLDKARRTLGTARLISSGSGNAEPPDTESAMSRAYYAAFYAAQAAILSEGFAVKTHAGTHDRFREHFVLTGRVPADVAQVLAKAFRLRQIGDYDAASSLAPETVRQVIEDIECFIDTVERVVT